MSSSHDDKGERPARFVCHKVEQCGGAVFVGRCQDCGELHAYGASSAGLRARKCRFDLSPGKNQAIELDVVGAALSLGSVDLKRIPFAEAGRLLCPSLEGSAASLSRALVGAALGVGRIPHWARRRFGRVIVDVFDFGQRWSIDGGTQRQVGKGSIPLLAALSGASIGAIAVMVLRLLGVDLPALDWRQIQAFIDTQLRGDGEGRGA